MFQRDYILRQIQVLVQVLSRALLFKKERKNQDAIQEVQTAGRILGLSGSVALARLTEEALVEVVTFDGRLDPELASTLAELMQVSGELYEAEQRWQERDGSYRNALRLALEAFHAEKEAKPLNERQRIESLIQALGGVERSVELTRLLFHYYDQTGAYARAEDVLFQLIDCSVPGLRQMGIDFYDRLANTTYTRLRRGNLPYKEVEEGRGAFLRGVDERGD